MPDEVFDVVNERDEVTGQALRCEVHARQLFHRAVHVLVFNRDGKLFLQKRSWQKDQHPGVWDSSTSGHLAAGEDYDAAAVREVQEEIGLALPGIPEKILKLDACPETGMEFVCVYRCRSEGPFVLQAEEIDTGAWFSPEEIDRWLALQPRDFAPTFPLIWKRLRKCG